MANISIDGGLCFATFTGLGSSPISSSSLIAVNAASSLLFVVVTATGDLEAEDVLTNFRGDCSADSEDLLGISTIQWKMGKTSFEICTSFGRSWNPVYRIRNNKIRSFKNRHRYCRKLNLNKNNYLVSLLSSSNSAPINSMSCPL